MAPAIAVAAIAWLALLAATPLIHGTPAALVYALGSLICHQRPERSFHLAGGQLPVCARCLGIYIGVALGAVLTTLRILVGTPTLWSPRRSGVSPRALLVAAALPTAVTIVLEWVVRWDPRNIGRASAGVILGLGIALIVLTLHYEECVLRRPTAPNRPPTRI